MIGYIRLTKDNGKVAWLRCDEIAAFSENETKVDGKTVPCITVMLRNNVAWHFPDITGDQFLTLMRSGVGDQVNVIKLSDLG